MKVVLYTSERSVSLQKVTGDIRRVFAESGVEVTKTVLSPDVSPWHYRDADAALIVMTFDTVWAKPFFVLAWILQDEGLRVRFYTTIEGRPKRFIGDEWIYRDLSFVANSEYTARKLREAGATVTDVVHHGIFVEDVAGAAFIRDKLRREMGFSERDFVVGYVAGAYERKGHAEFAEVIRIVGEKDPSVKFVVVTQDRAAHIYRGLGNCTTWIEFGQLDEATIYGFYHMVDLYAQPSLAEGFGLPALEALAAGKPVVHADYEPLSEITTPETSFRVPVKLVALDRGDKKHLGIDYELHVYDPAEFAEAILQAKDEVVRRREELRELCVSRAKQLHARKTYMRLLDLLR